MTEVPSRAATQASARWAGGLYLLVIAAGIFAEVGVREVLIVRGDSAATAANIASSESLFRLGFVADLVSAGAYAAVAFLLYALFREASPRLALSSALLGTAGSLAMIVNLAHLLEALSWLGDAPYLASFAIEQRQALAMASLRSHGLGYMVAGIVFGAHLLVLAILILRSGLLPRLLGALLALAWLGSWTNALASFLALPFASSLFPWILLPNLVAEGGLALWLLAIGVRKARAE
ncbi:MAG TPA: DUF4386 domain-containing protein [Allosphingosinicella sp.]|nr:DUF4386 domain-containing protein [Allosphingosinicella sp.]